MKAIITKLGKILLDDNDWDFIQRSNVRVFSGYNKHTGKTYAFVYLYGIVATRGLHRFILGLNYGEKTVDHINGNPLDNQRSNLRICSKGENNKNKKMYKNNTSGYKGVSFDKIAKSWKASIGNNAKRKTIGFFDNPVDAAKAYNKVASGLHGEFASLNIVEKK